MNLNIWYRRIYGLTRALLEMMKYLQYSKLYFQWKLWYKKSSRKQCVKVSHFWLVGDFSIGIAAVICMWWKDFCYFTTQKLNSSADISCFSRLGQDLPLALVQFCSFSMFIGHSLWSQRQQIRLVSFPKTGPVQHKAQPSSSVCLWRGLGLRREIHVLSACSANG